MTRGPGPPVILLLGSGLGTRKGERMKLTIMAIAALAATGSVAAQDKQKTVPLQMQEMQLPEQVINPAGKQPALDGVLKSGGTARAVGCISHQVYNIQGLNLISTGFVLSTSSGDQVFHFQGDAIRHVPAGSPVRLSSTLETNRWDRILTTLERAAAADKPLLINYNLPGRDVYSIHVQWSQDCSG